MLEQLEEFERLREEKQNQKQAADILSEITDKYIVQKKKVADLEAENVALYERLQELLLTVEALESELTD